MTGGHDIKELSSEITDSLIYWQSERVLEASLRHPTFTVDIFGHRNRINEFSR